MLDMIVGTRADRPFLKTLQAIQDSKICKSIMAKDFSHFGTRDVGIEDKGVTVLVKREVPDDDDSSG